MGRQSRLGVTDAAVMDKALAEVRAVYHEVAERPMERDCRLRSGCCHFRQTGKTPHLTRGEALVLARGLRASGRTSAPDRSDGACPLLGTEARCLVYESRPFGCRTHFCPAAGGPAERHTVLDLIRRLESVDEALGGDGPKPLPQALHEALAMLNRLR